MCSGWHRTYVHEYMCIVHRGQEEWLSQGFLIEGMVLKASDGGR